MRSLSTWQRRPQPRRLFAALRSSWRRLADDRRAAMLPLLALAILVVVGAGAFAVDVGRARALGQSLKSAADAAALAAATRLPDTAAAAAAALAYVEKNMPSAEYGQVLNPSDIAFGTWDAQSRRFTAGDPAKGAAASAVRVTTRLANANQNALATVFGGVLGIDSFDVTTSAIAGRAGAPCVIALDPAMPYAMNLLPGASLEANGCGVQVNSTSKSALGMQGDAALQAADICVGGGTALASGTSVSPEAREYCPGIADPMAGLLFPAVGSCDYTKASYKDVTTTLAPGVYCGGLKIDGTSTVTLAPGNYIIRDGAFTIAKNAAVSGSDVTIFLTGKLALINFAAGSQINLSAPTDGDHAGVLFFQDPKSPIINFWLGRSTSELRGVVYLPSGALYADGANNVTPERSCTVLITKQLYLGPSASVSIDLSGAQCRNALPGPYRRGVVLFE